MQHQFIVGDRRAQLTLQRHAIVGAVAHVIAVNPVPALRLFGDVHGGVGLPHQHVRVVAVLRKNHHADARPDLEAAPGDIDGCSDRLENLFRDHDRAIQVAHRR